MRARRRKRGIADGLARSIAAKGPRLCPCFDEGIMRAALPGAKVTFDGSLATGATRCRHLVAMPLRRAGG